MKTRLIFVALLFAASSFVACIPPTIHTAAARGDISAIQKLLSEGTDVNAATEDGETPLYFAVAGRQPAAVGYLLDNRAYVDYRNSSRETPLFSAISRYVELKDKQPAEAAQALQIVDLLLARGANPNAESREGETPVWLGASFDDLQLLDKLLRYGASLDTSNRFGIPSVALALSDPGTLTFFQQHGVDLRSVQLHGIDLLTLAVYFNYVEGVRFLLDQVRVDPNVVHSLVTLDLPGRFQSLINVHALADFNALDLAVIAGRRSIVEMLLKRGVRTKENELLASGITFQRPTPEANQQLAQLDFQTKEFSSLLAKSHSGHVYRAYSGELQEDQKVTIIFPFPAFPIAVDDVDLLHGMPDTLVTRGRRSSRTVDIIETCPGYHHIVYKPIWDLVINRMGAPISVTDSSKKSEGRIFEPGHTYVYQIDVLRREKWGHHSVKQFSGHFSDVGPSKRTLPDGRTLRLHKNIEKEQIEFVIEPPSPGVALPVFTVVDQYPVFSPDGKHIAFFQAGTSGGYQWFIDGLLTPPFSSIYDFDEGNGFHFSPHGNSHAYLVRADGQLSFMVNGRLFARGFEHELNR